MKFVHHESTKNRKHETTNGQAEKQHFVLSPFRVFVMK